MNNENTNNWTAKSALEVAQSIAMRDMKDEMIEKAEQLRVSNDPAAELDRLSRIDLSPIELRAYLNNAVKVAVQVQKDVNDNRERGVDEHEIKEQQAQADVLALLAATMGLQNKAVENPFSGKRKITSGNNFKKDQIERLLIESAQEDSPQYLEAALQVAKKYEIIAKPSLAEKAVENSNVAKALGVVTIAAALSFGNNATPAMATETSNTNPALPESVKNGMERGAAVKVNQRKVSAAPEIIKANPVVAEKDQEKPIAAKKVVTIKNSESKTVTQVSPQPEKKEHQSPVVVRKGAKQTVEVKPIPSADQKKKESVVRVIPPVPATPPVSDPEAAPAPTPEVAPVPNPEQGPYQLTAEQNAIIDSLNLSANKKDFLREVTAGAITLNQRGSKVNPEVMIAQAVLESGWGESKLANQYNNYFGTKAGHTWQGKTISMLTEEVYNGQRVTVEAVWPAFESAEECFNEYEKFITNLPHFADALEHTDNPQAYVDNLLDDAPMAYATDPDYATKIMGTIKANQISRLVDIAKSTQADQKAAADAVAAEAKRVAEAKAAEENAKKIETVSQPKTELAPVTALQLPVPEGSPTSPQYAGHKGIDFAVPAGTPFYAAMGGTVEARKFDVTNEQFCKDAFANLGRSVSEIKPEDRVQLEVRITRIIDGRKYVTIYAHMDRIDVEDGQIVEAGHQIGLTGNTGCSTGDHAHFEMQVDDMGSVAPHLLFDGEKWKAPGAIVPWSIDIKPQSVDSDGSQSNEDGPHDTFCGCGNHTNANSTTEVNRSDQSASESGAQNSLELSSYEQNDLDNRPVETILPDAEVAKLNDQEHDLDVVNQILARLNSRQTQEAAEAGQILQSTLQASKK